MNFNRVTLGGRLTRDPQIRDLPGGSSLVEFGLAVNRKFKGSDGSQKDETLFVDCTAFGKQGEIISQYCQKGKELLLEGRLRQDVWEDKQSGQKRSKISVVVENFQLMGGGEGGAAGNGNGNGNRKPARGGDEKAGDSEIPF